jgi:hypothetical protein
MEKIHQLAATIRTQPTGVRKLIQIIASLALTILIAVLSFSVTFFGAQKIGNQAQGAESVSPFSLIRESFTEAVSSAGDGWESIDIGLEK